jgi:hypothetical protein
MLKINIYVRSTNEYSRHSVEIDPSLTQEEFEEEYINGDDCYNGDVVEVCPYFSEKGNEINVYTRNNNSGIHDDEKLVFTSKSFEDFTLEKGGSFNYIPSEPKNIGIVNIWYSHDMKHVQTFFWHDVESFDLKKLVVKYGTDTEGKRYFEKFEYDGHEPDDYSDEGDTGYGYDGPHFVYNKKQEFSKG